MVNHMNGADNLAHPVIQIHKQLVSFPLRAALAAHFLEALGAHHPEADQQQLKPPEASHKNHQPHIFTEKTLHTMHTPFPESNIARSGQESDGLDRRPPADFQHRMKEKYGI